MKTKKPCAPQKGKPPECIRFPSSRGFRNPLISADQTLTSLFVIRPASRAAGWKQLNPGTPGVDRVRKESIKTRGDTEPRRRFTKRARGASETEGCRPRGSLDEFELPRSITVNLFRGRCLAGGGSDINVLEISRTDRLVRQIDG